MAPLQPSGLGVPSGSGTIMGIIPLQPGGTIGVHLGGEPWSNLAAKAVGSPRRY